MLIAAVTGFGEEEARRATWDAGIHYHFAKPAAPSALIHLAEQAEALLRAGPKVLVVDSDTAVADQLVLLLGLLGFAARAATYADDAVRKYHPDVGMVLLDVPPGGHESASQLLGALRQVNPRLRCWIMTGSAGRPDSERLQALGATGVLAKPLGTNYQLVRKLKQLTKALPLP